MSNHQAVLGKHFQTVEYGCTKFRRSSTGVSLGQFPLVVGNSFCKCSIPVFDGLFPSDHNKMIVDLLFTLAHWHGLAKLRMLISVISFVSLRQKSALHTRPRNSTMKSMHDLAGRPRKHPNGQRKIRQMLMREGLQLESLRQVPTPMVKKSRVQSIPRMYLYQSSHTGKSCSIFRLINFIHLGIMWPQSVNLGRQILIALNQ
jgi:hypothetical protein